MDQFQKIKMIVASIMAKASRYEEGKEAVEKSCPELENFFYYSLQDELLAVLKMRDEPYFHAVLLKLRNDWSELGD